MSARIRTRTRVWVPLLTTLAAVLVLLTSIGHEWNHFAYDLLFDLRGPYESPDKIVVVAIDELSFDHIDQPWPWPRGIHGKLIDELFEAGVQAVAFDILFAEPTTEDQDRAFAEAISRHAEQVVLVNERSVVEYDIGDQIQIVDPTPVTDYAEKKPLLGLSDLGLESDGFVRKLILIQNNQRAFAHQAAAAYRGKTIPFPPNVSEDGSILINFLGPKRTINTISYYQALAPKEHFLPKELLDGALVFIGFATATEVSTRSRMTDHYPVPYSKVAGGYMPGVEIHAQIASNFLSTGFISTFPARYVLAIGAFLGVLSGYLFLSIRPKPGGLTWILIFAITVPISYVLFSSYQWYVSPVQILFPSFCCWLASPFLHYLTAWKQRNFIRGAFSTYLSEELVNELLENPDRLALGGEEKTGTVLFLDIVGFTSFSEQLSPTELIDLINRNLGAFADTIIGHDGMIDKYIGDCIMALWGIPIPQELHATEACRSALDMLGELEKLNESELGVTGLTLSLRIGINSGEFVAGNVGGGKHFNYTVLGNNVNLAARLEGINKFYGTKIIISEYTADQLEDEFVLRKLDTIRVKGQKQAVTIYELVGRKGEVDESFEQLNESYNTARELYSQQKFANAVLAFRRVLEIAEGDGPATLLLERCELYAESPPADWDGVYELTEK